MDIQNGPASSVESGVPRSPVWRYAAIIGCTAPLMGVTARAFFVSPTAERASEQAAGYAAQLLADGQRIFRYDTFGDEQFWGGALRLHHAFAGARFGGVGNGVSPALALAVGLKVDVDALPPQTVDAIRRGAVDANDPANTLALLQADAVVGVKGVFTGGQLTSVGIQCSFCHSSVDDSFAAGVGRRLDGWPNRDLNVGAIVALSPDLSAVTSLLRVDDATVRRVLQSWGPGKFDPTIFLDGMAFRPDGNSAAVVLPAAFGLAGVNLHTATGWGGVSHWNALVANLEMHGRGSSTIPGSTTPLAFLLPPAPVLATCVRAPT